MSVMNVMIVMAAMIVMSVMIEMSVMNVTSVMNVMSVMMAMFVMAVMYVIKSTEVQTLGAASRLATTTQIRSVHDQPMCSYVISHVIAC